MRASYLSVSEELTKTLIQLHDIVNLIEAREIQGIYDFREWLFRGELLLKNNNIASASQLSAIRLELANFTPNSSVNKKKQLYSNTSRLLSSAQACLFKTHQDFESKVSSARDLINQLLGITGHTGLFKYCENEDFSAFLEGIWNACSRHEQLSGLTVQILGFVNKADAIMLLAENIELAEFS